MDDNHHHVVLLAHISLTLSYSLSLSLSLSPHSSLSSLASGWSSRQHPVAYSIELLKIYTSCSTNTCSTNTTVLVNQYYSIGPLDNICMPTVLNC